MKRFFATIMLAATLGLVSCGENSLSSSTVKANLESKSYTVEVMSKTEAEARIQGFKFVVTIKDALWAEKGETDCLLAFFCSNINDATALMEENVSVMVGFAEKYTKDPVVGSHNNVTYVGSKDAARVAGIPVNS